MTENNSNFTPQTSLFERPGFYLSDDGEWIPDGWSRKHWEEEIVLNYGKAIKGYQEKTSGYPVFGTNGHIGFHDAKLFNGPAAILGRKGANRGVKYSEIDFWVVDTAYGVEPKNGNHPKWLYYKLIADKIGEIDDGSPIPSTPRAFVYATEVNIPGPDEQKAIAAVLGSIDDKIELLREQNETLEALAQTLFKRWFIDFNFPDENGNPYKDSGGAMIASEFGEIPEAWKVAEFQEIITLKKSGIRSDAIDHEVKYVGLEHIPRKHLQLTEHGWGKDVSSNKTKFSRGDILFGKLRPYFHKVCIAPFEGICSTDILVLNVVTEFWYSFALMHVYSERLIDFVTLASTGTRMPRTSFSEIGRYKIPLPPQRVAKPFDEMCRRFFEKASDNTEQIETLIQLRDTLLPKLMKGEIRVPAER